MAQIHPENPFETPQTELFKQEIAKKGIKLLPKATDQLTALVESLTEAQQFFIALEDYHVKPFNL